MDTGISFPIKKCNYESNEDVLRQFEEVKKIIWKDRVRIQKVMIKQPSIQLKILQLLTVGEEVAEEDTRIILCIDTLSS